MSLEEAKFCTVSTVIQCHSYFSFSKIDNSVFSGKYTSKTIHHQKNGIMTFHKKKHMEMVRHGRKFDFVSNILRVM